MRVYRGIAALSDFRQAKLLSRLQKADPSVTAVTAEYVHIVDAEGKLSAEDDKKLAELTTYGTPFLGKTDGTLYLVVPRPGTISPWSSKATDIVHNSGLASVKRLERATAYYVAAGGPKIAPNVAAQLHDRMTEAVLPDIESAKILFEEHKPKPLGMIDISGGKAVLAKANRELGLAMADEEVDYLYDVYKNALKRNPTDVELMMFGQVNSEHTRHKVFNADC